MPNQPPICTFCEEIPTRHRCMHRVEKGGVVLEGGLRICGDYICAPCSLSFGSEEGIFRCDKHCDMDDSDAVDSEDEVEKEVEQPPMMKKKNGNRVAAKGVKSGTKQSEYSAKDLLVLSQAFVRVSENAIEGVNRKGCKFWDDVAAAFIKLKQQQEAYDARQRKKDRYNQIILKGDVMESDDDDDVEYVIPVRTAGSLQQKWSKYVQPNVTKFISLTNRYPIRSGEGKLIVTFFSFLLQRLIFVLIFIFLFIITDRDRYYSRIHLIFLEQYPEVKSFDIYRPSWEFLKDAPKFQSIIVALNGISHGKEEDRKSTGVTRGTRAMGTKKCKRLVEEEKILENVSAVIKGNMNTSSTQSAASGVLAAALEKFTTVITASIQSWQECQAYKNADPELKRKYDNLILMGKIAEMERATNVNTIGTPLEANRHRITPSAVTHKERMIINNNLQIEKENVPAMPILSPPATSTSTNIATDSDASDPISPPKLNNNMASCVASTANDSDASDPISPPKLNNNMASCAASTTNNINKLTAATNHSAVARPGNGSFRWHASLYNFARMRQHSTIGIQDDSQPIVYEDPQEESLLF